MLNQDFEIFSNVFSPALQRQTFLRDQETDLLKKKIIDYGRKGKALHIISHHHFLRPSKSLNRQTASGHCPEVVKVAQLQPLKAV